MLGYDLPKHPKGPPTTPIQPYYAHLTAQNPTFTRAGIFCSLLADMRNGNRLLTFRLSQLFGLSLSSPLVQRQFHTIEHKAHIHRLFCLSWLRLVCLRAIRLSRGSIGFNEYVLVMLRILIKL
jgi:hypothetical protein